MAADPAHSQTPNDSHDPIPVETENGEAIALQRDVVDRRAGMDRRQKNREESGYDGPERRKADRRTGLERRRGAGIRREEDRRSAEEGEMTPEQFEFVMAIETYKKVNKKLFPTWTEVLDVIQKLGYRKVQAREINLGDIPDPTPNSPESKAA
jgi:hypothetical protein